MIVPFELFSNGRLDDALDAATDAVKAARTKGEVDLAFATALGNSAELLSRKSRFAEATPLFEEASRLYRQLNATSNSNYATLMNNFGMSAFNQGQYQRALEHLLTSIKIRSDGQSPDQHELATTFNNLGDAEAALGNPTLHGNGSCSKLTVEATCPKSSGAPSDLQVAQTRVRSGSLKSIFKDGLDRSSISSNVKHLCPLPDTSVEINCISEALGESLALRFSV